MLHALANGRAPIGQSASARARRSIGRWIGQASAVWTIGFLLLLAPMSLVSSASSCHPAKPCGAPGADATGGETSKNGKGHESSTQRGHAVRAGQENGTKQHGAKQHETKQDGTKQNNGQHLGSTPSNASHQAGAGRHHHAVGAGHGHRHGQPASGATIGQSSSGGEPTSQQTPIGRANPPVHRAQAERGGVEQDEQDETSAWGARSVPSSRALMGHPLGASRPIEHVGDALRFPAALLTVILLFLALQQRADRRDQMLESAPVGSRQETLEFR
jgi:hypothetical protein